MSLEVTVKDLETGETETRHVPAGDYLLITVQPCHEAGIQVYPKSGTHVVTIKGRKGG